MNSLVKLIVYTIIVPEFRKALLKALLNSSLTCSKSCYRSLPYQKRGQESCKFQYSPAPANSKIRLMAFPWPR